MNYGANGTAITPVPNIGCHFVNWSDGSTANPRTDTSVTSNVTVTATFAINTYTLTYAAGTNGTVSGTSPQTVNYGANGTMVTALPAGGYAFTNWSDGSTADPRTDTDVTNAIVVTANFISITNAPLGWTGGGTDGNWSTAGNWNWALPAGGQALAFLGLQQQSNTNDFLTAIGQVVFGNGGFALSGNPVTLQGGLVNESGSNSWNLITTLGGVQSFVSSNGMLTVSGAVTNAGNVLTLDGAGTNVVSGMISGSGGLVKNGTGTAVLTTTNAFTGSTTVNAGVLALAYANNNGPGSLSSNSSLTINGGGTVQVNADNALDGYGGPIGSLPVTIYAGGRLTGSGVADGGKGPSSHIRGVLTLKGGTLTDSGSQAQTSYGTWDLDDGVIANGGTNVSTIDCLNVVLSQTGGTVFNVVAGGTPGGVDLTVSGTLAHVSSESDTGIIKTGTGVMTLSGTNSYIGATVINAGVLRVDGVIGTNTVTVVTGGTLAGSGVIQGASFVQTGGILMAGDGSIGTLTVSNNLTLNGSVANLKLGYFSGVKSNDQAVVSGTVTYGGSLAVANVGIDVLAAGESFQLFKAGSYAGGFTNVTLPALATGLTWYTNNLPVNGTIAVSNLTFTLTYTAGANGSISGTSPQTVIYGASGTAVTAVANTNYHFVKWSDGYGINPRTDTGVTNNITVSAIFTNGLPTLWLTNKVGGISAAVTAGYSGKTFTLSGTGTGLATNADGFWFAYLPATNNLSITAQVTSQQTNGTAPLAGVMIRPDTNAGSVFAFLGLSPTNNAKWLYRTASNTVSSATTFTNMPAPYWVQIIRGTNTFTSYVSSNGTAWVQAASVTITNMATNVLVGLAVSAGTSNTLNTAVFNNVVVTNNGAILFQPEVIGAPAAASARLASFSINGGRESFTISGDEGSRWRLEASDDLGNWTAVETVTLIGGSVEQSQPHDSRPARFYRLVQVQ